MDLSDFEDATYALVRSGPVPYWLPATFTAIAGDNQSGTPGQFLSEPLSVQLTNILGAALKDVIVEWRVTSGGGELSWAPGVAAEMTQSTTNISGITGVFFRPLLPGRTVVQAVTPTLTASPVSFTIDVDPNAAPWVLVYFGPQFECLDDECVNVRQLAPTTFYGIPSEGVPLGTTLEFVSCCGVTQLASVLVPQGGSTFKSEPLVVGQRFAVVLDAVGTWVFEELRWGGRDSIKVTPRP
jgi:hypothetical protein